MLFRSVSRVALKDADGNPLLDSEGKQKYQMYLTFNSFRFDISVEYNGAESVNHYSVSGLNLIQSYSSFNYSFYSALASMMGSASPIANPGTLSLQIKFDENLVDKETFAKVESVRNEDVLAVRGKLCAREGAAKNPRMKTGMVEVADRKSVV